jgi:hypothetical protein
MTAEAEMGEIQPQAKEHRDCQDFQELKGARWSVGRDHGPIAHFDFIVCLLKL